jgi:hypothetical protein
MLLSACAANGRAGRARQSISPNREVKMAVTSTPHYSVLVEVQDNLEDLRDMAFAAAHDNQFTSTEHWDEKRSSEVAFCFTTWEAALLFTMHCARTGIPHRNA